MTEEIKQQERRIVEGRPTCLPYIIQTTYKNHIAIYNTEALVCGSELFPCEILFFYFKSAYLQLYKIKRI